jgi:hypothetical protein
LAVQLARHAGAELVDEAPVELVFDTVGGELPAGERIVPSLRRRPGRRISSSSPTASSWSSSGDSPRRACSRRRSTRRSRSSAPRRRSTASQPGASVARWCSMSPAVSRTAGGRRGIARKLRCSNDAAVAELRTRGRVRGTGDDATAGVLAQARDVSLITVASRCGEPKVERAGGTRRRSAGWVHVGLERNHCTVRSIASR